MTLDETEARRWFRRKLEAIAKAYPDLKSPDHQEACDRWLKEEERLERDNAKEGKGTAEGNRQV
jgi:hypothetical protein